MICIYNLSKSRFQRRLLWETTKPERDFPPTPSVRSTLNHLRKTLARLLRVVRMSQSIRPHCYISARHIYIISIRQCAFVCALDTGTRGNRKRNSDCFPMIPGRIPGAETRFSGSLLLMRCCDNKRSVNSRAKLNFYSRDSGECRLKCRRTDNEKKSIQADGK